MTKRFNIRAAFEEAKEAQVAAQLEVDKEAAMSPEDKAIRDNALQLADKPEETPESTVAPVADTETKPDPVDTPPVEDDTSVVEPMLDANGEVASTDTVEGDAGVKPVEEDKEDKKPSTDETLPVEVDGEEAKAKDADDKEKKEQEKEATEVVASLESISGIMKRSLDKGGLTPMSASATSLVLKQLYNRVGMTYKPEVFPAMESYNSISSRKRNTESSIESLTKSIDLVKSAIKRSVEKSVSNSSNTSVKV